MKCTTVHTILPDYAAGDLSPQRKGMVEKHLRECPECRKELEFYQAYLSEASGMRSVHAPDDFTERLHEKLGIPPLRKRILAALFLPLRTKLPLEAAGLLAIALFVFFFWRPYEPPTMNLATQSEIKLAEEHAGPVAPPAQALAPEIKKTAQAQPSHRKKRKHVEKPSLIAQNAPVDTSLREAAPSAQIASIPEESLKEEKSVSADSTAGAPSEAKVRLVRRETFWIAMAGESLAFQKDETIQAAKKESERSSEQDSLMADKQGESATQISRKERAGRQWVVDERIASLVIEAHGMITSRKRGRDTASYTVELPSSSRDSFVRGIKKLGEFSESAPAKDDSKKNVVIKIILIITR